MDADHAPHEIAHHRDLGQNSGKNGKKSTRAIDLEALHTGINGD
jgi:hypothetical protein